VTTRNPTANGACAGLGFGFGLGAGGAMLVVLGVGTVLAAEVVAEVLAAVLATALAVELVAGLDPPQPPVSALSASAHTAQASNHRLSEPSLTAP
jgi:hypothetical protein